MDFGVPCTENYAVKEPKEGWNLLADYVLQSDNVQGVKSVIQK